MDANASGKTNASGKAKRDWLAFDGLDYVATKIILGITAIGTLLYGLGVPVVDAVRNAPLAVSYLTKVSSGVPLPRGTTHDGQVTMELLVTDPTLGERLGQALPGVLGAAMTVAVVWQLFRLLRTTQSGDPFTTRNVRRINTIALIVGFGSTLVWLSQAFADNAMFTTGRIPLPSHQIVALHFTLVPVVVMMVIFLIGETFRRGVALRDDVEGLV